MTNIIRKLWRGIFFCAMCGLFVYLANIGTPDASLSDAKENIVKRLENRDGRLFLRTLLPGGGVSLMEYEMDSKGAPRPHGIETVYGEGGVVLLERRWYHGVEQ